MAPRIPGATVTIVNDTGRVAPPVYQRYPVVIGVGDPYNLLANTKIVRGAGTDDTLPVSVVGNSIHDIISAGDLPGIAKYVKNADYEIVPGTNLIRWLGSTKPTTGYQYYTTYTETRSPSAYQAILYFDENLVYTNHGGPTRLDGVVNDVSKGASLCFEAGSKGVMVLQLDPTSWVDPYNPDNLELENAFLAAIPKLELIYDYKLFLLGMSSGTLTTVPAAQILFNHAVLASEPDQKQERSVLMAMPKNTSYTDFAAMAQAFHHERMCIPAIPTELQLEGLLGTYDSRFYCCALAGLLCSGAIGQTYHDEIIPGIVFSDNFSVGQQNYLVQNSVSPAKSRSGVVRNVMALTTDGTDARTEDLGIQDIKDYVKKFWREGLWAVYKNKPINSDLLTQVVGSSKTMLDSLIDASTPIIASYGELTATQDKDEPRKIRMTGKHIVPAYSVAYFDITFEFSLS